MSTTLVGVFDDAAQAQQASRQLEAAGIDRSAIRVQAGTVAAPEVESEDRRGFFAKLFGIGDDDDTPYHYDEAMRRGNSIVSVSLMDDSRVDEVTDILEDCGAADVDERVEQWKASGYVPSPTVSKPMASLGAAGATVGGAIGAAVSGAVGSATAGVGDTLKSVEEELKVGKRTVQQGRVRVHRSMTERPVEEQLTLREEVASIERKKVDRPATEADLQSAFQDKTIEIVETSEEPVVSKVARVVEEVTVGKKSSERTETVRDTVRSTKVEVDEASDAPLSARASMYPGPERRFNNGRGSYSGQERRSGL